MKDIDPKFFHQLYGIKKPRISYRKKDFLDYVLMTLITAVALVLSYGPHHFMAKAGMALCAVMPIVFLIRHGVELGIPVILRRPQDILFMLVHKLRNLRPVYFIAVGLLLLENYLISLTPKLPHHVELMRTIGMYLFYIHFGGITLYRTAILFAHLRKKDLVREVLLQTSYKTFISKQRSIGLEIVHAYLSGLLAHIVLIAPWYVVIQYANFSVVFLPVVCLLNFVMQASFTKELNAWFYRDHWLGHNSEFEFVYFHGTHHDAIPCGLIGVSEHGHLEGFMRNALGFPGAFFNPIVPCLFYTIQAKANIDSHQYIPGVFPKVTRQLQEIHQHSIHHFGRLEPYGFGLKVDQPGVAEEIQKAFKRVPDEVRNSIKLDEALTGFQWENPKYRQFLSLVDKYSK